MEMSVMKKFPSRWFILEGLSIDAWHNATSMGDEERILASYMVVYLDKACHFFVDI